MKMILRLLCWPFILLAFLFLLALRQFELAWDNDDPYTAKALIGLWYILFHLKPKPKPNV